MLFRLKSEDDYSSRLLFAGVSRHIHCCNYRVHLNWYAIRIINNVFVSLDYEIPADSALFIYAFTQNYSQTAVAR